eukprot:scaffold191_cov111-Isochrysis_galbana.AAC.5
MDDGGIWVQRLARTGRPDGTQCDALISVLLACAPRHDSRNCEIPYETLTALGGSHWTAEIEGRSHFSTSAVPPPLTFTSRSRSRRLPFPFPLCPHACIALALISIFLFLFPSSKNIHLLHVDEHDVAGRGGLGGWLRRHLFAGEETRRAGRRSCGDGCGQDATGECSGGGEGEKAGGAPSMRLAGAGSDGVPNVVSVHDRPRVSESALCEGGSPVWPWSGARCLASVVPGASCSRASVSSSIGGSHKHKHTSQARGDEARKAKGGGERNLHLVFRGRWTIARGPSHTPFGGVRSLASTYRRCGANWAPPDSLYSHTPTKSSSVRLRQEN